MTVDTDNPCEANPFSYYPTVPVALVKHRARDKFVKVIVEVEAGPAGRSRERTCDKSSFDDWNAIGYSNDIAHLFGHIYLPVGDSVGGPIDGRECSRGLSVAGYSMLSPTLVRAVLIMATREEDAITLSYHVHCYDTEGHVHAPTPIIRKRVTRGQFPQELRELAMTARKSVIAPNAGPCFPAALNAVCAMDNGTIMAYWLRSRGGNALLGTADSGIAPLAF